MAERTEDRKAEQQPETPVAAGAAPPLPAPVQRVLALQRSAGNAAVAALLAGQRPGARVARQHVALPNGRTAGAVQGDKANVKEDLPELLHRLRELRAMTDEEHNADLERIDKAQPGALVPQTEIPNLITALRRNEAPLLTPPVAAKFCGLALGGSVGAGGQNHKADLGLMVDFLHGPDYFLTNEDYGKERPAIIREGAIVADSELPAFIAAIGKLKKSLAAGNRPKGFGTSVPAPDMLLTGSGKAVTDLPEGLSETDAQAALTAVAKSGIGKEAIIELQRALYIPETGLYDLGTVYAVYRRQRQWTPKGPIAGPGIAGPTTFAQLGLIFTKGITAATVGDKQAEEIKTRFPHGVTVAIYANLKATGNKETDDNNREFKRAAEEFAGNSGAIGLGSGGVTLASATPITTLGEVITTVQSIHRGLVARHEADAQKSGTPPGPAPAWTQIKNLALFAHGENFGIGMNESNDFNAGGMHVDTLRFPSNIRAFVRGISGAVLPSVQVQLYACSTAAAGPHKLHQQDAPNENTQGSKTGENSFAAQMAQTLGPEATVYGHTTAAHTTENYSARVFGKEGGGGQGGALMFDVLYPEAYIQKMMGELFPARSTEADKAALHDPLRKRMFNHYTDSVTGELARQRQAWIAKKKFTPKFPRPIGQEMFVNPEQAAKWLHADFPDFVKPAMANIQKEADAAMQAKPVLAKSPAIARSRLMRTEFPPGKEADKAEFWGSPDKAIPPITMGQNIAKHLLSDPKYHDAAPELLNGWWLVHIVDAVKVIQKPFGKLDELAAAAERRRFFRVTLAVELVRNPEGFDPEPLLAKAKVTPEERKGLMGYDAAGNKVGIGQLEELKQMQGRDLARKWPEVMRGPAKAALTPERRQAILDHVKRERARVQGALRPELTIQNPYGNHPGLSYSKSKAATRSEVSPTNYATADPADAGKPLREKIAKLAWQELLTEGSAASLNAWDPQLLTVGRGFGVQGGQGANVLRDVFESDPIARGWMVDVGFTMAGTTALFLDADTGQISEGDAALHKVEQDKVFGSQFMHVFEEKGHDQAMVNAQLAQMRRMSAGVPDDLLDRVGAWPDETIRFAVHLRHFAPGHWEWPTMVGVATDSGDVHRLGVAGLKRSAPKIHMPAGGPNLAIHKEESHRVLEWAQDALTKVMPEAPATATPLLDSLLPEAAAWSAADAKVKAAEKKHEPTEALVRDRDTIEARYLTKANKPEITALAGKGYVLDSRTHKYFTYTL